MGHKPKEAIVAEVGAVPDSNIYPDADKAKVGFLTVTQAVDLDAVESQAAAAIPSSEKGAANGVADLDAGGKVPFSQLPTELMAFLGNWDASTNSPTLADGTGSQGQTYRVSVAGSQDLGSGSITYAVGDWVYHNGTIWQKGDNTDAVASVFGRLGAVTAQAGDYNADQISETAANKIMTAAERTNLGNQSGTNTGDEVPATETIAGIAEIATQAEVTAQADDARIVTPLKLAVQTYSKTEARAFLRALNATPELAGVLAGSFPTTHHGNAIVFGDGFRITAADTLGTGTVVAIGDLIVALQAVPGQTDANWLVIPAGEWELPPQFFFGVRDDRGFKNLIYKVEGTFFYDPADFDAYTSRKFEFFVDMNGSTDAVSVQFYDRNNVVQLGALTGILASGEYSFTWTRPATPTTVEIALKKDTNLSTDPILESNLIEIEH